MFKIKGLQKKVANFEIRADFELSRNEIAGITGRSGSGKTTLLRTIAGLETWEGAPDGGIWINEKPVQFLPIRKRKIGFVFQGSTLFPALSVWENASFGLRVRGVSARVRKAQALEWLNEVGLANHCEDSIEKLSGGERQRLAFVRAWIWKPDLVLMDEPFSALDPDSRSVLQEMVKKLHKANPVPVIVVTHERQDLNVLGAQVFSLNENDAGSIREIQKLN